MTQWQQKNNKSKKGADSTKKTTYIRRYHNKNKDELIQEINLGEFSINVYKIKYLLKFAQSGIRDNVWQFIIKTMTHIVAFCRELGNLKKTYAFFVESNNDLLYQELSTLIKKHL